MGSILFRRLILLLVDLPERIGFEVKIPKLDWKKLDGSSVCLGKMAGIL